MGSKISWCDETWNAVTGCTKCSPGCLNCYAEVMAKRLKGMGQAKYRDGFNLTLHERCLTEPLKWKKAKTIFVCSISDLFHPDVPFAFLDKVFAVMALCPQHTFVLCTKRAERMREYLQPGHHILDKRWEVAARSIGHTLCFEGAYMFDFPLPNCHLGVTVESHEQLGRAIKLSETPAAHRWLSVEPMLDGTALDWLFGRIDADISSVIVGCESGPNRRPCNLDWARQVRDDCQAAGVKLYVKQLSIDGKVVTDPALFPEDLRQRDLSWTSGKR